MNNSEITFLVREKLTSKWIPVILAFFILTILPSLIVFGFKDFYTYNIDFPSTFPFFDAKAYQPNLSIHSGNLVMLILGGAFSFGGAVFGIYFVRGYKTDIELIFAGFRDVNRFLVFLASHIIIAIFTLAWTLLFIIPGIMAALSYSMTFYLLVDHPEMGSLEAIQESKRLMKGHKWQLFSLWLRFITLGFLCLFTLGIGFIWLIPYANICIAQFYDSLLED